MIQKQHSLVVGKYIDHIFLSYDVSWKLIVIFESGTDPIAAHLVLVR